MRDFLGELPLEPALALDAAAPRGDFDAVAGQYDKSVGNIAATAAAGAMLVQPASRDEQRVQDIVTWRMDGDILDNRFDFATRLAVRVADGAIYPHDLPLPSLTERTLPIDQRWPESVRMIGRDSLRLLGVEWRHSPLVEMRPLESVRDAIDFAQFTHKLATGDVRYKADPAGGEANQLSPLPTYDTVAATAYGRFTMRLASALLGSSYTNGFAQATQRDRLEQRRPIDDLDGYRAATAATDNAGMRISQLGTTLYAANPNELTAPLVGQLMRPDAAEVAVWAQMNKAMYHAKARTNGGKLLMHRLQWVAAVAPQFQQNLRAEMLGRRHEFVAELNDEIDKVRASVTDAQQLESDLAPPKTIELTRQDWRIRAK